jgi:hypothetical protein
MIVFFVFYLDFLFVYIDRPKSSKTNFTRSSSFHASLRRSNKTDPKLLRTYSTSPPNSSPIKTNDSDLKRSKSTKEIMSKSTQAQRSKATNKKEYHDTTKTSSIIPFINQCIQSERTPDRSKPPLVPPKRPPPPIPKKLSPPQTRTTIDNHIYDSFQDSPSLPTNSRRSFSHLKKNNDENRTVSISHLPPMRVTEL